MGFYDVIAKDISWAYTSEVSKYCTVSSGKLLLPKTQWLAYNLRYLDTVIEAIHAFRKGQLANTQFDLNDLEITVIDNAPDGIKFLTFLEETYTKFAIDIEADNLSTDATQNKLLCFGIAYERNKSVVFLKECFYDADFRLKFQLYALNPKLRFILHNGIFDRSRLAILENLTIKIDEDTLLKHYVGINEHKGTHSLKDLAQLYLGFPAWEAELDQLKRQYCRAHKIRLKDFKYSYFPQKMLAEYNGIDCCATFQLDECFDVLMRDSSKYIYRKLIEASPFYADMITRGMLLDVNYWEKLKNTLESERTELEIQLREAMPGVSPNSPVQLLKWLQDRYPFENIGSTDAKTLDELSRKYPQDVSLQKIKAYRKNGKYLKTYVVGLWKRKDYQNIIHCEFKLHGTETGRLSSSNPNMQNIPRSSLVKSLFVAREGYTFLQLDYSQLELRVLAHISQDDTLIKCYKDGRDLHSEMQQKIFKSDFDSHDKDQRMAAKIVNFGIPYGRGPSSVAEQLRIDYTTAKKYLADWHAGAPKVKNYIDKCHKMALADPQDVWYTVFGRARHYYVTNTNKFHVENQSVNFPITSTANDITVHALIEIGKWLLSEKIDAYLVNTVHDSIILEVRPADVSRVSEVCQEIMAAIPNKYLVGTEVPFKADAEVGTCWGDLKEPDFLPENEEDEIDESDSD